MHRIARIAAAVIVTLALAGLASTSTTHAQAPPICLTLDPGQYEITVPALAGNPAGTLVATIGDGGQLLTLVEPGGVDLVAIGAVHGLLPLYEPHLPDGVAVIPCAGASDRDLPNTGSGGLLGAGAASSQTLVLVLAASLGFSALSLLTLLERRRRALR